MVGLITKTGNLSTKSATVSDLQGDKFSIYLKPKFKWYPQSLLTALLPKLDKLIKKKIIKHSEKLDIPVINQHVFDKGKSCLYYTRILWLFQQNTGLNGTQIVAIPTPHKHSIQFSSNKSNLWIHRSLSYWPNSVPHLSEH